MLSVIIINKNKAHAIGACLASEAWADEIIVVNSGSDDDTVAVCQKFGTLISKNEWTGYSKQKNYAFSLVKNSWILSIDADERVTPELRQEIEQAIANSNDCVNFKIPILSIFLAGLRYWPLGRKERPATSEATLLYRAWIGEGMQTPSQSLASSQRDFFLLLWFLWSIYESFRLVA